MNLTENETIKYQVVCDDSILLESVTRNVAENFVSTLATSVQERVQIVPITTDGLQVLLG